MNGWVKLRSFAIVRADDPAELLFAFHLAFELGLEVYIKNAIPSVLSAMWTFRIVVSNPSPCDVVQMVYAETEGVFIITGHDSV